MIDEPLDPDDRAEWLVEQGRMDEAIAFLEAQARSGLAQDVERSTEQLVELGRVEEAAAHWRAGIEAGMPWAYGGLARTLADAGRTDEAVAGWRAAVEAGEPGAKARLAALLAKTGRIDAAIAEYRAMIAAGDVAAGADLAKVYARAGQFDEAVRSYRSAMAAAEVSRWPLGALLEKFGHTDGAVAAYRAAVDAGERHVRERLMRLLAAHGHLAEATQVARDIVAEPGSNPSYRQLGWLLAERRHFEEFEAEALLLKDDNPVGLAYLIAGAHQSAVYHEECPADCKGSARVVLQLPGHSNKARQAGVEPGRASVPVQWGYRPVGRAGHSYDGSQLSRATSAPPL